VQYMRRHIVGHVWHYLSGFHCVIVQVQYMCPKFVPYGKFQVLYKEDKSVENAFTPDWLFILN